MLMSIDSLRRHLLQDSAWDGVGENFAISKRMKRIVFIRQDQCRNRDARPVFLLSIGSILRQAFEYVHSFLSLWSDQGSDTWIHPEIHWKGFIQPCRSHQH